MRGQGSGVAQKRQAVTYGALTQQDVLQLEISMDDLQQPIGLACRAVGLPGSSRDRGDNAISRMALLAYCWCEGVHVLQRFTNLGQPLHSDLRAVQALAGIDHLQHATDTRFEPEPTTTVHGACKLCMVPINCVWCLQTA